MPRHTRQTATLQKRMPVLGRHYIGIQVFKKSLTSLGSRGISNSGNAMTRAFSSSDTGSVALETGEEGTDHLLLRGVPASLALEALSSSLWHCGKISGIQF